uniref:Uncharacterized protein n=1 Tax=Anguilla anguilla TaxID=7936 RepID=A0A0E9SJL3_ANGAN
MTKSEPSFSLENGPELMNPVITQLGATGRRQSKTDLWRSLQ